MLKEMKLKEFVRRLKDMFENHTCGKFVFFIGAGCSVSSKIPSAGVLVNKWLRELKKFETGDDKDIDIWASGKYSDYDPNYMSKLYSRVIFDRFPIKVERQDAIENFTTGCDPAFGYAVLANLIAHDKYGSRCCHVMTTNFDDLIADALYIYTQKKPLVVSHTSLVEYAELTRLRPLVFKLHGDAMIEPKNTPEETRKLPEDVKIKAAKFFEESAVIFIGYGGHDESIADLFRSLPDKALPWGTYWISEREPDSDFHFGKWLNEKENTFWVRHKDFDELMLLIKDEFDIAPPDRERFNELFESYENTFKSLQEKIGKKDSSEEKDLLEKAVDRARKDFPDSFSCYLEASNYEKTDPEKAQQIYESGMDKFSNDERFLSSYATFLSEIRKDYDQAEIYFKRATQFNRKNASVFGNYASFLIDVRKDYDQAEMYFKKAIMLDPNNAPNLTKYAILLSDIRKDYNQAEKYFQKAIELNSNDARVLSNYAIFLSDIRKDYEQVEKCYRKAIELEPNDADILSNYAVFLTTIRKDYDQADFYYQKAMMLEPNNSRNLINCATLLTDIRKEYDRAEKYFQKAIELNSNDIRAHMTYAIFLTDIRKSYNQAEKHLRKAIELEPNDVLILSDYAKFLSLIRKDYDQAEKYFKQALALDPNDVRILINYTVFLSDIRRDYDQAEKYFKQAFVLDPNDVHILIHYAIFLSDIRKNFDQAEQFYLKAIELEQNNAQISRDYAVFLYEARKNFDQAEKYFQKATELNPYDAGILCSHAVFLDKVRGNSDEAEKLYIKLIGIDSTVPLYFGNYADLLLSLGRKEEGFKHLNKAFMLTENEMLILVFTLFQYAQSNKSKVRRKSLAKIKELINKNIRCPRWDLKDNIQRAIDDGHPSPEFLKSLADVINEKKDASELDKFPEWNR